jgi:hypothetical protein
MAMSLAEYELEALPELEGEYEYEAEWEGDLESEEFFGWLRRQWQAVQTPGSWQRRAAIGAGKAAMTAGSGLIGTALGGPVGAAIAAPIGAGIAGAIYPERAFEAELEWEMDGELSPLRRVYPDALMEHLGHAAKDAESEAEAEAYIGALVPLAARIVPQVAPAIMRAAPNLIRGVSAVARTLRRSPTTQPLVRTIPTIVRRTAANIAQQVGQGQPATPQAAVRTLARQTARVVGSPQQSVQAYQRSRVLDRQFHRAAMPGAGLSRMRGLQYRLSY